MVNVEEYLYYHENQDYSNLRLLSCTYYQKKQQLVVRYLYTSDIEPQLNNLKKALEEMFMKQVGLPIKYNFVYKRCYIDELSVKLEITSFLRKKFGKLAGAITDEDISISLENDYWKANLHLPKTLIKFLENSNQWQCFIQDIENKYFYPIWVYLIVKN